MALLLPVKILAAAMMPIMGQAGHHDLDNPLMLEATANPAVLHDDHQALSDPMACEGHDPSPAHDGSGIHEHVCPHLGIAFMCTAAFSMASAYATPRITTVTPQPLISVVLDVPTHPPRHV